MEMCRSRGRCYGLGECCRKFTQIVRGDFRNRPVIHSIASPMQNIVAALRWGRAYFFRSCRSRPGEKIYEMFSSLVNERGDRTSGNILDAAADQRKTLIG